MIGFNGTHAATATNLEQYPLLQDVNIGWLQKIRTSAPDRVIDEVVETSGKVTIGAAGDYKTLEGLVFDALQLLEPWHRKQPGLRVFVSRNLLQNKLLKALEKAQAPTRRSWLVTRSSRRPALLACPSRMPRSSRMARS